MAKLSGYELEREANIVRNRALLEELDLKEAVSQLGIPAAPPPKTRAKPIQPTKRLKREREEDNAGPRRSSARLRGTGTVDPKETPEEKRKREAQIEEERARLAEEQLMLEEQSRMAKRPRHQALDLKTLAEDTDLQELSTLTKTLETVAKTFAPRQVPTQDAFLFEKESQRIAAEAELKEKMSNLKVVARAKVTQDRIYSAAYHPEVTKDLVFFGDKHGQLGIWDARATSDALEDQDKEAEVGNKEGGKYWRMQLHWPATSKSSISSVKFDPIDSHTVYTSSYDCTIRSLAFESGVSKEIFSSPDTLITSIDLVPAGHEMYISDAAGGVTHLDMREDKDKARWYGLSDAKIGAVSVNPTNPHYLLTSSNNRLLKIWDTRNLHAMAVGTMTEDGGPEFDQATVNEFVESVKGKCVLRGEWSHGKSVSSAYWDPRGRSVVSTSYDNTIRLWEYDQKILDASQTFPSSRPFKSIKHNSQTGKWLTILRAQWSPNANAYPHFTIGNMNHSLDVYSCTGELIARLADPERITAVQAVTCSHPNVIERVASGNGSGRCVLWAPTPSE